MLPRIYFDLGSPYAYLAVERAESVFGSKVDLQPILLGAIFKLRGWGTWVLTDERDARLAEIEDRARRYGLPPLVWPSSWAANSLPANRAATWAKTQGAVGAFSRAVYRRQFAQGADITDVEVLRGAAVDADLDPDGLAAAIQRQAIKDALRQATDQAWAAGVRGVPTISVGDALFFGDDRLEEAAASLVAAWG
jgi:2-hydroxychromene-2-carboxylate isomerase